MTCNATRNEATGNLFAIRLRVAQDECGLTNEACAREVGVTLRTWQHWRAGTTEPRNHAQRAQAARVLGRSLAWFYEDAA